MAYFDTRTRGPVFGGVGSILVQARSSFAAWNAARSTRAQMSKLSDRELDDIGLTRGDVDSLGQGDLIR